MMRSGVTLALCAAVLASASQARADGPDVGSFYHGDVSRSGDYKMPGLTWNSAATMHESTTFVGSVAGRIQAEPLYWRAPGAANGMILVETDQNNVQALDSITGLPVWQTSLGATWPGPVPCGNKALQGVAGTPAIDRLKGIIYMDASVVDQSGAPQHRVFALSLLNGSVLPGWPLDIASTLAAKGIAFAPAFQGQRGALALVNGELYVPFGGNRSDCNPYHGYVVGIDVNAPGVLGAWVTRAPSRVGIWSQGGVMADARSLYFTTGNADDRAGWADGEAVIRLNPNLQHSSSTLDYYAPSNYLALDTSDLDLGANGPMLVDAPTGPTTTTHWLLQLGKDGNAHVLNRTNLGGIGGALLVQQVATGLTRTAPASWDAPDGVYVAFNGVGSSCPGNPVQVALTTLKITAAPGPVISTVWCGSLASNGSPIVTTVDNTTQPVVWIAGSGGDHMLHGYRGDTGQVLFSGGSVVGGQVFSTILAAENRLFVGGTGRLYAFDFTPNL